MKVLLSWSGARSRLLAEALRGWLRLVVNNVNPWMSAEDIKAGNRWNVEVARQLEETHVGIFCMTKENTSAPWLHFEAGAISKQATSSLVCTLLFDIKPEALSNPFSQFQAQSVEKSSILQLIRSINQAQGNLLLDKEILEQTFEKWWPDLENKISKIPLFIDQGGNSIDIPEATLEEVVGRLQSQGRMRGIERLPSKENDASTLKMNQPVTTDQIRSALGSVLQNLIPTGEVVSVNRWRDKETSRWETSITWMDAGRLRIVSHVGRDGGLNSAFLLQEFSDIVIDHIQAL